MTSRASRPERRTPRISGILVAAALTLTACAPDASPFRIERAELPDGVRLTLVAASGARINARLKPALELDQGGIVRFDSPALTADSAYFAGPPSATVSPADRAHGLLRVSVCPRDQQLCRTWIYRI